jgi:F-type H+-transporting ATPase subunit b
MDILHNSTFVVGISFVAFIALLVYLKVPGKVAGLLDARAERIRQELDEARRLREEAQSLLATYERKQKEVVGQAEAIVAHAKTDAERASAEAHEALKLSIVRRVKAAEDQIASAEAAVLKDVKDRAVAIAVAAASEVIAKNMSAKDGAGLIDAAIDEVGAKLH